ncbi:pyridoxamine 5'-phosphate oxidase family protein [Pseudomethylobacillus aquaticus]|uniref:Pyridoxamine 5'-phosphate oxidase family protein n=1 Tax=Pseudomethylobacillus aquaticus TaxID=2676064 RepID=A0A3N0V0T8_9PROT|nr:pyridoxamine 5'-phosphate oxidase family protein [Pseudomethylobacillus aquaticus]ROH86370.1 pyridoxamine 5'-phosphate oxidase family protein [Pseudomethylobacillus aquaticus]
MSRLFGDTHRSLQDELGTRKLADRIEEIACKTEFDEETKGFIAAMDMFFLATVDHNGRPTVSYKGGFPGFVKVIDSTTLAFPSYDGNGMYLSVGNVVQNSEVGLLFISFETPHRIRVQGVATASRDDPLMAEYKEAEFIVRVKLSELWQNCPRYIHRYTRESASRYVPSPQCETPVAGWKRIDLMQDVLSPQEHARAENSGLIGIEEWIGQVKTGDPQA